MFGFLSKFLDLLHSHSWSYKLVRENGRGKHVVRECEYCGKKEIKVNDKWEEIKF